MARWNIQGFASKLPSDCELRAHENRMLVLQMINGQLVANQKSATGGLSSRVYQQGAWGFASSPDISAAGADRVLSHAQKNATVMSKRVKPKHGTFAPSNAKGDKILGTPKKAVAVEALIEMLNELDAKIVTKYPDVKSRTLIMQSQEFEKELFTTGGADCYSLMARSYLVFKLGMDSQNGPVDVQRIVGNMGYLGEVLPSREELDAVLEETYQHLKNKSNGILPQAGMKEVVLHSKMAGILAHEAIGHTTEADIVLGGSVAGDYMGQQVASPLVTLVDYAHTALGQPAALPVFFDDEGVEAQDTVIIENGVLKNYMHSRESAAHFGHKATGHARAWGFNDEPLIRMRNTAILPGRDRLDDMIASIDDGYFLMDHSNGQADSTSEFMFGVTLGYEIKKGKLGRALLNTTISGIAFDMLKSVSQVSNEMTWVSSGHCGKKQLMSVGMGGPAIKCRINIGGH